MRGAIAGKSDRAQGWTGLEIQLQRQLDLPRVTWPAGAGSQNGSDGAAHLSERSREVNVRAGISEIGMVEGVEEFGSEL
jgi:hypothetical protein